MITTSSLLSSVSLASAMLAGTMSSELISQSHADSTPDSITVADAYSIPYQPETECRSGFVRAAHLEAFSTLFFREGEGFNKHAVAAARILHDRAFTDEQDCAQVDLLDFNPFTNNMAVYNSLIDYDVITISSYIPWHAPQVKPPETPEDALKRPLKRPDNLLHNIPHQDTVPLAVPRATDEATQMIAQEDVLKSAVPKPRPQPEMTDITSMRSVFTRSFTITDTFWDTVSRSIIVLPATNQGNKKYDAKTVTMTFMDRADSMIITGALADDNSVAAYSTNIAPDFVWYTGFSQGFCFPYYATETEIQDMAQTFGRAVNTDDTQNLYSAHAQAGLELCDCTGTSFVSPDIGGFMAQAIHDYPYLHEMEITVAAYLATTRNINGKHDSDFHPNGRGLPFDDFEAGHGAFMPDIFFLYLHRLGYSKEYEGLPDSTYMRYTTEVQSDKPDNLIRISFDDYATAIRTIGDITFTIPEGSDTHYPIDAFPETITVYSPEGTQYDLPLRIRNHNVSDNTISAGFSVSAYLGENIAGDWHFEAPPGFHMAEASLSHVTADMNHGNSINHMIDSAMEWSKANPFALAIPDGRPWDIDENMPQRMAAIIPPPVAQDAAKAADDAKPVPRPVKRPDYMIRTLD